MDRRLPFTIVLVVVTAPAAAGSVELSGGVRLTARYTSDDQNDAFGQNTTSDYSGMLVPRLGIDSETKWGLVYRVEYEPTFRTGFSNSEDNSVDHDFNATATYPLGPNTNLTARYGINVGQDLLRERAQEFGVDTPSAIDDIFRREQRIFNTASLQLRHNLSARLSTGVNILYSQVDSSDDRRFDSNQKVLNANLTYMLSERQTIGIGTVARFQEFDDTETQVGSSTDFYSLNATWSYRFSPSLNLAIDAGPMFVRPGDRDPPGAQEVGVFERFPNFEDDSGNRRAVDVTTCPRLEEGRYFLSTSACELLDRPVSVEGVDGDRIGGIPVVSLFLSEEEAMKRVSSADSTTLAALATLTKRWKMGTGQISYRRSASDVSGLGSSSVADMFSASFRWSPTENWRVIVRGNWTMRRSTNDVLRSVQELAARPTIDPFTGLPDGGFIGERTGAVRLVTTSSSADVTSLFVHARIQRQLRRNLWGAIQFGYTDQKFDQGELVAGRDFDGMNFAILLNYDFESIRF